MHALAYLSRLCRRWGGELILLPSRAFSSVLACPEVTEHPYNSHAIHRARSQIFADHQRVCPGTVIHEMGHVFLEVANPARTHEPDWLGWEIALARRARCYRAWSAQNRGYSFAFRDEEWEWGDLPAQKERQFIADRMALARRLGILSREGVPLCTRENVK